MDQIFEKFGLHLNLLIAQIVNFGVLFFVLYRFAYKPILNILDQRRNRIETSLKQAKEIETRTQALEQNIVAQLRKARQDSDKLIAEAKEIGEKARNELLVRTNQEITGMLEKTKADINQQKEQMMGDIQNYILETSVVVVEKLLKDKLDKSTRTTLVADSFKELQAQPLRR